MASNFKTSGTDVDSLLLDRSYTILSSVDAPGDLWTWGTPGGTYGTLGLNDQLTRSSPTQVGSFSNWKKLYMNEFNGFSIKTDGTLWAWGSNSSGTLGQGDIQNRSSPVQVGSLNDWYQISTNIDRGVIAIKNDKSLWAWGNNAWFLFASAEAARSSPVQVGSLTNWKEVSAQGRVFGAIKTDGTLWTWGRNYQGGLGLNNNDQGLNLSSPTQVGSLSNWNTISTGLYFGAAVKTDGTLWTWGGNDFGQLGLGDRTNRSSPVQVGSLTNWKTINCGLFNTMAIKTDGTLWVWGANGASYGTLGIGITGDGASSPVQVGSLTDWKQVSPSGWSTIALKTDGTAWVWGANNYGGLGLGDTVHRLSPVQLGSLTSWKYVKGGSNIVFGALKL